MKDYKEEYNRWLNDHNMQSELHAELIEIEGNEKEIEERFYKDLEFGTGGIRGIISAGTNRINIYTIRKTTKGLANYILKQEKGAARRGVVIAYDSRRYSWKFAEEAAKILATNNIRAFLFEGLRPVPILSFAVRQLNAFAGIVITASHNPPEYNGYKVYNMYGNQITEEMAKEVYDEIGKIEDILDIQVEDIETLTKDSKIIEIGHEIDRAYIEQVKGLLNMDLLKVHGDDLSVVYTPLHGTGNQPVKELFRSIGLNNLFVVKEQESPDPQFSTIKVPNPEEREVFELAMDLAKKKNADILMATDPDADRIGVLVQSGEDYKDINGNQLGVLLLDYILKEKSRQGTLPDNGVMIKTIVTSALGKKIAEKYGVETENTLTGFKYIGEQIEEYHQSGAKEFVFGYEESYGYLAGDFVRDKDAVQIAALIAEMALAYKREGKTLLDVLEEIYQEHGYYIEDIVSVTLKGREGIERIQSIITNFRENYPKEVSGVPILWFEDYLQGKRVNLKTGTTEQIDLPSSNVIKVVLENGAWVAIRPSGTEPKLKLYFSAVSDTLLDSIDRLQSFKKEILRFANLKES